MSLKIKDISAQIGRKTVLRNATFEAETGEITGICGWSGAGKTSLLRAVAGSLPIQSGTVTFETGGASSSIHDGRFQYVPASARFSRWRAVFGSAQISTSANSKKQSEAVEKALHSGARVILLDDAVCFLDRRERNECFAMIRRETPSRGLVVIYATSDYEEILLRCDRAAVLHNGEIVHAGTPEQIYLSPKTKVVAEMTGRNNIFEVRRLSSSKADVQEFQTIEGGHRLFAKRAELSSMGALNQNTFLAIRPEQISLSFGASFPEDNLLRATIVGTHFLGPSTLVSLDCGGLAVDAAVPRLVGLTIGDECMVGLPPDRLGILNK